MAKTVELREAPPLPQKLEEWQRRLKAERTLNDLVEDIHRMLIDDPRYRKLLRAVYDAHSVEGSLSADNIMAAGMIRAKADEIGSAEIAGEKLAVISMALGVVLRRYGESRKERRLRLHGTEVPNGSDRDTE